MSNTAKTEYVMGDAIELTGRVIDGFEEFMWVEGHRKGTLGSRLPKGVRATEDEKRKAGWRNMQAGFSRLAKGA